MNTQRQNPVTSLMLPLQIMVLTVASCATAANVSLDSLLREMTDFSSVARWPSPPFSLHQCSSYDRAKVAPDKPGWFANNDFSQYIREENHDGRTEKVMMDADGPGCIVRFWLTTVQNKKGTLRIYLDGQAEPAISFPAYDLLSGDLGLREPLDQPHPGYHPADNGGNTLMLPIPYAKHCKVTWEEAGEGPRYYQINYRTYPAGTTVRTFTRRELEEARPLIERTGEKLFSPPNDPHGKLISMEKTIAPGGTQVLNLPGGPAAVERFELKVDSNNLTNSEQALRSLILKMDFDGEQTVWCPVTDFFGSGVGINPLRNWYRTVNADGSMVCRWVMPYAESARVLLINLGNQPVSVSFKACADYWKWDARSMYFHAVWHYDADLTTPPPRDWNAVHVSGRGTYVGDTLALFNSVPTWYGEGDEKIWVDGESFPSLLGTGMEDYYDFSFAPRGLMQTPFANQVRVDQPMTQGNNVLTRTRNLDGIPFKQSLDFNFELISWKPTSLNYAMTTYWYAFPGANSDVKPQPEAAARTLPSLADVQKKQMN